MRYVLPIILAATFSMYGCSSKIEIEGEAFVETNGIATKLANVEIQIIPEEQFSKFIKSKAENIEGEVSKIKSQIKSKEDSIASLNAGAQAIMSAQMNVVTTGSWNTDNVAGQYMQKQQDALFAQAGASVQKSADSVRENEKEIENLKQSIDGLKSGKNAKFYYDKDMPGAVFKASTNSDGKFKIDSPSGKRMALIASKGDNYWFLWVKPDGPKAINLTNANSSSSGCGDCIFDGKTTPQSL